MMKRQLKWAAEPKIYCLVTVWVSNWDVIQKNFQLLLVYDFKIFPSFLFPFIIFESDKFYVHLQPVGKIV